MTGTTLRIVQGVLAIAFPAHGLLFLFPPEAARKTKKQSPFPQGFVRFVHVAEVLTALGLILSGSTGLPPWPTPLAAAGLAPMARLPGYRAVYPGYARPGPSQQPQ